MRHLGAVLGVGVALVLAAGCAQQESTGAAGGSTLSTSTPPHTASMAPGPAPVPANPPGVRAPAGAVVVPAGRVDAKALPFSFPKLVWTDRAGTTLGFEGEAGGCFTSRAEVDEQTATGVTVRMIQQQPGTGERSCPMFVRYRPMAVHLAQPLGNRTVTLQLSIIRG
ncbi:MAG TPA: hypothetical protein VGG05_00715 [Pseudonocardiaceae bacterium]|jgi:hypothetical protein